MVQLPNPLRHTATLVDTITICLFKLECTIVLFQTVMCMHCVYYRTLPPGSPHRTRLCFYMYMCVCCLAFLAFSSPLIRTMYVCVYFWAVPQLHGREWWPLVTLCVCVFFSKSTRNQMSQVDEINRDIYLSISRKTWFLCNILLGKGTLKCWIPWPKYQTNLC